MKNVHFITNVGETGFSFLDPENGEQFFPYYAPVAHLWPNLKASDFSVELLINSNLNLESNAYLLKEHIGDEKSDGGETIGAIFPISILDTESTDFFDCRWENYVYVSFITLLERIRYIPRGKTKFSECFEDNVCVCIFNNLTVKEQFPLSYYIHSLRRYGYCYFCENNSYSPIEGYDYHLSGNRQKNLTVNNRIPALYSHPTIDVLLRALPYAHNVTYRFILLYQVIEYLIDIYKHKVIDESILDFRKSHTPPNDFANKINQVNSEKVILSNIFKAVAIPTERFSTFRDSCTQLFDLIGYTLDSTEQHAMFYAFRNQMTHSYRNLHEYPKELTETIQSFEEIVLYIVEKHPHLDQISL